MYKIIQVGVGGYGGSWLSTIMDSDKAQHVALIDIDTDNLERAKQVTGINQSACFISLEEGITKVEADALLCVVPPAHHEEVIITGLSANLHVLSEKPIAHTLESAHRILTYAQAQDRIFMISQKARFHPWVRRFQQIANNGEIGQLSHMTHYFRAPYYSWGEFRHKMSNPLFIEMSIHHFDLIRALLGRNPVSVWADSWNTPNSQFFGDITGIAHFTMENRLPVTYHADAISSGNMTDWYGEIRAIGETGTLTMLYPDLYIGRKGADHENRNAPREEVMPVSPPQEGQLATFEEFLDAIENQRIPESNGIDNLNSLAMVFAAIDSSQSQTIKHIPDYLLPD